MQKLSSGEIINKKNYTELLKQICQECYECKYFFYVHCLKPYVIIHIGFHIRSSAAASQLDSRSSFHMYFMLSLNHVL